MGDVKGNVQEQVVSFRDVVKEQLEQEMLLKATWPEGMFCACMSVSPSAIACYRSLIKQ